MHPAKEGHDAHLPFQGQPYLPEGEAMNVSTADNLDAMWTARDILEFLHAVRVSEVRDPIGFAIDTILDLVNEAPDA